MARIHGNTVFPNDGTPADKHRESPQPPTHLGEAAWTPGAPSEKEGVTDGGGAAFPVALKV